MAPCYLQSSHTNDLKMDSVVQNLELVVETRILVEMKIENHGKIIFCGENKSTSILFSCEN